MARLHVLIACAALVMWGGTASACMNDEETPTHEREFRSQYAGLPGLNRSGHVPREGRFAQGLLVGGGVSLLVASFAVAARRSAAGG